jgi:hypothetical protein
VAFPQIATSVSNNNATNSTSHTVTLPTGIAAGDLLVILFVSDGSSTISVTSPASGWTATTIGFANGTTARLSLLERIADGAEASTITVTTSANQMSAWTGYRITGTDTSQAIDVATAAPATTQNPDPPSGTAVWGGAEDNLFIAVAAWDSNPTLSTYPTNYSTGQLTAVANNATHGAGVASACRELAADTDDPGTFALSASIAAVGQTLIIRPAAAVTAWDGDGDLSIAGAGIEADGTFDVPVYDASPDLGIPASSIEGDGTFDLPVYDGTADLSISGAQVDGDADYAGDIVEVVPITQRRFGISGMLYGSFEGKNSVVGEVDAITQRRFGIWGMPYGSFEGKNAAADEYAGSADLGLPGADLTSDGTFAEPEYDGSADLSLSGAQFTIDGSFAEPSYDGTGDLSLPSAVLTSDADFALPQYDASPDLSIPAVAITTDGAIDNPATAYEGSAELSLPSATLTTEAQVENPETDFDATVALSLSGATLAATADFTVPQYDGSAELSLSGLTLDGDAEADNPASTHDGLVDFGLPTVTLVAVAVLVNPAFEGTAVLGLPGVELASTGLRSDAAIDAHAGACTRSLTANITTGSLTTGHCTATLTARRGG